MKSIRGVKNPFSTTLRMMLLLGCIDAYALPETNSLKTNTQSVEMRSDYYMNQSETFFREGASGEISSIAVQAQGKGPIISSRSFLGEQYSLSKPAQIGWKDSDRYSASEGWNYFKPQ